MASNYQDSSSDMTDSDAEYTQNEKELLDYVLENIDREYSNYFLIS